MELMRNPRPGRPQKKATAEIIKKVELLASRGLTERQICTCIGWCADTFILRKKSQPKLDDALKRGQASGIAQVTNALFENALAGNLGAQCFYLKNRAGWSDTVKAEISNPDGTLKNIWNIHPIQPVLEQAHGSDSETRDLLPSP